MAELTKSQKARNAIKIFKTTADALALRGYYKPSGRSGQTLLEALKLFNPEIYGAMNDPRKIELDGLEYVLDRLPKGIENCSRITLTANEAFDNTSFEMIMPMKRRRVSYRVSDKEMCFVITRGLSEIYDILTHITFLENEAEKIKTQVTQGTDATSREWKELEDILEKPRRLKNGELDQALWILSIILGRTFAETRKTYAYLEKNKEAHGSNLGLFRIIHSLGARAEKAGKDKNEALIVYFTPSLKEMIGHHQYAAKWANAIKLKLMEKGYQDRPIHIISANLHSVVNLLYGYAAVYENLPQVAASDVYEFAKVLKEKEAAVKQFALGHGLIEMNDESGSYIDYQIIDTNLIKSLPFHPDLQFQPDASPDNQPVLVVMDYAFGTQAFEVMDELLGPYKKDDSLVYFNYQSLSVMGKAGILPGRKNDIMLATAHVLEGATHSYIVDNDLNPEDFQAEISRTADTDLNVYVGPIVTVLGTSLQNRDVLRKFQKSSWSAVGLEMEGGHYQRAVNAAIIRKHVSKDIKVRYAYYASDNPLVSGMTLASGSMGVEGVRPTYMITKVILEKIFRKTP